MLRSANEAVEAAHDVTADFSPAELRFLIERILAHREFEEAPRQRHLLRYLAYQAIAGGGRSMQPWQLEADVLTRRDGTWRSGTSPARSMVADLRRRLERYADDTGRGDPLRITIPAGECRLQVSPRTPEPPAGDPPASRSAPEVVVVEFDAEPAVETFARPLSDHVGERLQRGGDLTAMVLPRDELLQRGVAVEQSPAAWHARAGVHGMLVRLPGPTPDLTVVGASVRLIAADGTVVWTLWCEETPGDSVPPLPAMAESISRFVADGLSLVGRRG